jgi:hypothetical protein
MTHDFLLEDQPVQGGDVYFFRWILHNWSDKYCVKILRGLIPSLKPGAKIVLNDNVLPQPGVLSRWQENRLRYVSFFLSPPSLLFFVVFVCVLSRMQFPS